jgi:hypothetical protein
LKKGDLQVHPSLKRRSMGSLLGAPVVIGALQPLKTVSSPYITWPHALRQLVVDHSEAVEEAFWEASSSLRPRNRHDDARQAGVLFYLQI